MEVWAIVQSQHLVCDVVGSCVRCFAMFVSCALLLLSFGLGVVIAKNLCDGHTNRAAQCNMVILCFPCVFFAFVLALGGFSC